MKKTIILTLLTFLLVGCSNSKEIDTSKPLIVTSIWMWDETTVKYNLKEDPDNTFPSITLLVPKTEKKWNVGDTVKFK